jgi:hypothetical protein
LPGDQIISARVNADPVIREPYVISRRDRGHVTADAVLEFCVWTRKHGMGAGLVTGSTAGVVMRSLILLERLVRVVTGKT